MGQPIRLTDTIASPRGSQWSKDSRTAAGAAHHGLVRQGGNPPNAETSRHWTSFLTEEQSRRSRIKRHHGLAAANDRVSWPVESGREGDCHGEEIHIDSVSDRGAARGHQRRSERERDWELPYHAADRHSHCCPWVFLRVEKRPVGTQLELLGASGSSLRIANRASGYVGYVPLAACNSKVEGVGGLGTRDGTKHAPLTGARASARGLSSGDK